MRTNQDNKAIAQANNLAQKIRRLARREGFLATKSRRDGRWYFSDQRHWLKSPESGLDDDEALEFLTSE